MKYIVLPILLFFPLLYTAFCWFREEYAFTGKMLSYRQFVLLTIFAVYSGYCLSVGIDVMVYNAKDFTHQAGRALSFSGLWTFVLPGLIAPIIIFPRETLLYALRKAKVSYIEQSIFAVLGWLLLLLLLFRHAVVI